MATLATAATRARFQRARHFAQRIRAPLSNRYTRRLCMTKLDRPNFHTVSAPQYCRNIYGQTEHTVSAPQYCQNIYGQTEGALKAYANDIRNGVVRENPITLDSIRFNSDGVYLTGSVRRLS
ncbi:hypothetical protein CCACVL1_24214 [Corchorus capsularis]|uniref:Uncharacterized protein n=1 Tax=Corchorus capsularis TaxID=210143 RepID=A0A1R3GQN3_COCAP|nr:hypothetical protein CCACVL1_24214 [Corchorus capsularis]